MFNKVYMSYILYKPIISSTRKSDISTPLLKYIYQNSSIEKIILCCGISKIFTTHNTFVHILTISALSQSEQKIIQDLLLNPVCQSEAQLNEMVTEWEKAIEKQNLHSKELVQCLFFPCLLELSSVLRDTCITYLQRLKKYPLQEILQFIYVRKIQFIDNFVLCFRTLLFRKQWQIQLRGKKLNIYPPV